jgi:hypothetical protein
MKNAKAQRRQQKQVQNLKTGVGDGAGAVVHACNSSYSGGRDRLGGLQFEASMGKMLATSYFNKFSANNVYTCM